MISGKVDERSYTLMVSGQESFYAFRAFRASRGPVRESVRHWLQTVLISGKVNESSYALMASGKSSFSAFLTDQTAGMDTECVVSKRIMVTDQHI